MRDRRPAAGAELHPEPPSGLIGAMFILLQLALENRHFALIEVGNRCERAAKSPLTVSAMADLADLRISLHLISNRAAGATAFMQFNHGLSTGKK
jgi:hypothetical protein